MSTADKSWKIKRRLDDYLCRVSSRRANHLRDGLDEFKNQFSEIAVVGGMIRDVALSGTDKFRSDVDLVIVASSQKVHEFAAERNALPNRFGGFSAMLGPVKFDFWALEDTWAAKQGLIRIDTLADVTKATFFILDAAVYDLVKKELYLHPKYLDHLLSKTLDINLMDNPSKRGNMVRAVRRTLRENLHVGSQLREFFESGLSPSVFEFVIRKELELYGNSWSSHYRDSDHLLQALVDARFRKRSLQREFEFSSF